MKSKLVILAMVLATTFFWLPAGNAVSAQNGNGRGSGNQNRGKSIRVGQPGKHNGIWRKKDAHGYRNYGQYRRTQVGHRRYRLTKRYYTNDGIRLSRWVRIYY